MTTSVSLRISRVEKAIEAVIVRAPFDSKKNHDVIARYTDAVTHDFIRWIGEIVLLLKSPQAKKLCVRLLRCELRKECVTTLYSLARSSDSMPDKPERYYLSDWFRKSDSFFKESKLAGLKGMLFLFTFEKTSLLFISDLEKRARALGCADLTYVKKHGSGDITQVEEVAIALAYELDFYSEEEIAQALSFVEFTILEFFTLIYR